MKLNNPAVSLSGASPAAVVEVNSLSGTTPFIERFVEYLLMGCGLLTVATTLGILGTLAFETIGFLSEVPITALLFDTQWTPLFADKHFGIWPLVMGTVLTSTLALSVGLPFGLLAAIFLSELSTPRIRKWAKPALEVLAGVPTIVYGYFALVVLTPALQTFVPDLAGFNTLSPGIVIGIMITPMIASLSDDALRAVPGSLREASYGLGASKIPTVLRIVLPAARGGITASVILAVSRAIGETMVVAIAAGQQPHLSLDPRVPMETMTAFIVQVSMGDTPTGTLEYRSIFVIGTVLFLMTFVMNIASYRMTRGVRSGR